MLVTTGRGEEFAGKLEAVEVLKEAGVSRVEVEETPIKGLLAARVEGNPVEVVRRVKELMEERPELFQYTKRYIPLERTVKTDLEEMKAALRELAHKIGEGETFRITVEKRHTQLHTREIIDALASIIDRKVSLKSPDKVVLVEVFGALTGISVIKPDDIASAK